MRILKTRNEFPQLLNELGLTEYGAEVGVFLGKHASSLLNAVKFTKFYAIDQWKPVTGYNGRLYKGKTINDWENRYTQARRRLSQYNNCEILRQSSVEASKQFPDGYFDFVYLDGDHRYEGFLADVKAWLPKVRAGGILAGHDYRNNDDCQVKRVVDDLFGDHLHITADGDNWYIMHED